MALRGWVVLQNSMFRCFHYSCSSTRLGSSFSIVMENNVGFGGLGFFFNRDGAGHDRRGETHKHPFSTDGPLRVLNTLNTLCDQSEAGRL